MAKYELDFTNADHVENGILVKFNTVVTIPVKKDGKDTGVALYVGLTNFADFARRNAPELYLEYNNDAALVKDIAACLEAVSEAG